MQILIDPKFTDSLISEADINLIQKIIANFILREYFISFKDTLNDIHPFLKTNFPQIAQPIRYGFNDNRESFITRANIALFFLDNIINSD